MLGGPLSFEPLYISARAISYQRACHNPYYTDNLYWDMVGIQRKLSVISLVSSVEFGISGLLTGEWCSMCMISFTVDSALPENLEVHSSSRPNMVVPMIFLILSIGRYPL